LRQVREELADGVPPGVVLMDPAYGNDSKLRAGIGELVLTYMAGILPGTIVWRPGETPLPQHPSDFAICPMAGASGHDDARRSAPAPKEWLSVEWPEGAAEPDHYWLSTLPADITLERMVDLRTSPYLARLAILPSRRLSTQRISHCVRNATRRTQSQRCVSASREL
jgi:SRSO17 transposase